ncbi:hypothetical protein pb186bvf_009771 [Paramecium bursaria]
MYRIIIMLFDLYYPKKKFQHIIFIKEHVENIQQLSQKLVCVEFKIEYFNQQFFLQLLNTMIYIPKLMILSHIYHIPINIYLISRLQDQNYQNILLIKCYINYNQVNLSNFVFQNTRREMIFIQKGVLLESGSIKQTLLSRCHKKVQIFTILHEKKFLYELNPKVFLSNNIRNHIFPQNIYMKFLTLRFSLIYL